MTLGMSLETFTLVHVVLSLIGIVSGIVVLLGMFSSKTLNGMTAVFLITTALTSITGFMFPFNGVTPGIIVGAISMVALALAVAARYAFKMQGAWRWIYIVTSGMALFLNVLVLIIQSFQKLPALHALAPNENDPAALITKIVALAAFVVLTIQAVRKFHPQAR
jgi:hypothetical protein